MNKNLTELIKSARWLILIAGVFAILVVIAYVIARGWKEAEPWGQFGDFLGGVLNPVFAFANVVVLIVISYQLAIADEERSLSERKAQKDLAMYQIKVELLKEMIQTRAMFERVVVSNNVKDEIDGFSSVFRNSITIYKMAFPSLSSFAVSTLGDELDKLSISSKKLVPLSKIGKVVNGELLTDVIQKQRMGTYSAAVASVAKLITEVQSKMLRDVMDKHS